MKNLAKIVFIFTILCLPLTGCFKKDQPEAQLADENTNTAAVEQEETDTNTNQQPKRYYPKTTTVKKPATATPEEQFVVTQELEVKFYLVDKYDPGICYGNPAPVSDTAINNMINSNPGLSNLIKGKYGYTDNEDVYNKIKQLNGIRLTELVGGKYLFNMTDGQCCSLKAIEGEVSAIGRTITDEIIRQEVQNNC